MRFVSWDLGQQPAGARVRVDLKGTEANVRLLDPTNFAAYKAGRGHNYVGGHYKRSPVVLAIPTTGHWHLTIDYGGYAGSGQASVTVLQGN
ncbi:MULTISPECIES: DUF1883 domain-containing protein [Amycolatopsis]|uniref:DUF1883 domain-containing protein n=2 Tax=Amycolatopsis TaxID=1813 RepID=A0ABW5I7F3_9PSEU